MNAIWEMRKKSVGLLGNMQGDKRPIPFVEDTAVPPEHLADYIAEFRALLDARGLVYGMFGHVDAGVLHVRPAIDMKDPAQEPLIREITEEVVRLTRKYGGLLWGEHGKGVRSEFSPRFFGPLYPILQSIKAAFDPRNQLNPGKIAAPESGQLLTIDGLTTRGQLDRTIPASVRAAYDEALHCNGNGACFNWDPDEAMCPSYKATRDRRHSPKGRASLTREWLRQLAALGVDPESEAAALREAPPGGTFPHGCATPGLREPDFSHAVKDAMDGCLACKSCSGQCPIKVDVPTFRAKFLEALPRPLSAAVARPHGRLAGVDAAGARQDAVAVQSRDRQPAGPRGDAGDRTGAHAEIFSASRCGGNWRRAGLPIATPRSARCALRRGARAQRGAGPGRVHELV